MSPRRSAPTSGYEFPLREELGITPSPTLQVIHRRLLLPSAND